MSEESKGLEFDLDEVSVPVRIGGDRYLLVEANSETATVYRSLILKSASMKEGRVEGMQGVAEAEPYLVSSCLFKIVVKDNVEVREAVKLATVKKWPSRVVKPLFNKLMEISDLRESDGKPQEDAKNS